MTRRGQNNWSRVSAAKRKRLKDFVFERDDDRCQIGFDGCTGRATEIDHIIPRSSAPDLIVDPANMRAACAHCNAERNRKRQRGDEGTAPWSRDWYGDDEALRG